MDGGGVIIFCFVNLLISLTSILPLPSDNFKETVILSAVFDIALLESGGTRKRLRLDSVTRESKNSIPRYIDITSSNWTWIRNLYKIQRL